MKKLLAACIGVLVFTLSMFGDKSVHVRSYTRKDGTVVGAYDRAAPGNGSTTHYSRIGTATHHPGSSDYYLVATSNTSTPAKSGEVMDRTGVSYSDVVCVRQDPDGTRTTNIFRLKR